MITQSKTSRVAKPKSKKNQRLKLPGHLRHIHVNAAGIDLGAKEHWVCVPEGRAERTVRTFATHTVGLERMADWLLECQVDTVAMEATGVYWIAAFQVLERRGLKVHLVNARQIKNVDGRKSDLLDCQWIQQLHTYGLLRGSFRPEDQVCALRSYLRHRDSLVQERSTQVLRMQKALQQMNVLLHRAMSDITGLSGMAILRAIVQGQREPAQLASLVHRRVRKSQGQIAECLSGDYRPEHLFVLQQALELYDFYTQKIIACEERITEYLAGFETKESQSPLPKSAKARSGSRQAETHKEQQRAQLYRVMGVDLTAIEGIGPLHAQIILGEIGRNVDAWRSEKHFSSWLGLCPDNRISGGRVLSVRTRRVKNRVATALRMAAASLERQDSGMGAYYRRIKARLGPAAGKTATAHKLARLVYRMLKYGEAYVAVGQAEYETKFRQRQLQRLQSQASTLGYQLVAADVSPHSAAS